jgi:hypothetical protein
MKRVKMNSMITHTAKKLTQAEYEAKLTAIMASDLTMIQKIELASQAKASVVA